jgi:hypothetical protein
MRKTDYGSLIEEKLIDGETVHWSGKSKKIFYGNRDIMQFPISFVFGIIVIIFGLGSISTPMGLMLVLIGILIIFGKFIGGKQGKAGTIYYVTNKKVIVLKTSFGNRIKSYNIEELIAIDKENKANKIGTIIFKNEYYKLKTVYVRSVVSRKPIYGLEFLNIENVDEVYKLVNELKLGKRIEEKRA